MRLAHCYIEGLPVWKASLLVIKNTTVPARPENKTTERRSQPAALCALRRRFSVIMLVFRHRTTQRPTRQSSAIHKAICINARCWCFSTPAFARCWRLHHQTGWPNCSQELRCLLRARDVGGGGWTAAAGVHDGWVWVSGWVAGGKWRGVCTIALLCVCCLRRVYLAVNFPFLPPEREQ